MRRFLFAALAALAAAALYAVPAHPGLQQVRQADGTQVTVRLVGDEFMHYYTTADGYTIVKNNGNYEYATLQHGRVVPSGVVARDENQRSIADKQWLQATEKHLVDSDVVGRAKVNRMQRDQAFAPQKAGAWSGYKGLVILVEMNDKSFRRTDAKTFYQNMTNQVGFTGYTDQSTNRWVSCTGSVRDYFRDNSMNLFDPQFDVVGPVKVSYNSTDFNQTSGAWTIFSSALSKASSLVNFSNYDANNDGYVDMVYFIVAGYGANYNGNSSAYLWPHASSFGGNIRYNNKYLGRYACSVELYGYEAYPSTVTIDGIGTMCHEFSHVLGVKDHYDTDYGSSGGESQHPGEWDIMAGGSYHNYSRTPAGYTFFERYTMGFASPQVITQEGAYTLNAVNTSNQGYVIKTPVSREYFILDNRQRTRWDAYIPGHGMTVWRVDSTNTGEWSSNHVNVNPAHNYLVLLRAGQVNTGSGDSSDPFPGTRTVTTISNETTPSLKTWAGYDNELTIGGITETGGIIHFNVIRNAEKPNVVEDFETMPATTEKVKNNVVGRFASWNFKNAYVTEPDQDRCNGVKAVAMVKGGAITMATPFTADPQMIDFDVYNPSGSTTKFQVSYSTDMTTWSKFNNQAFEVAGRTNAHFTHILPLEGPVYLRINMTSGSTTAPAYIDDLKIVYVGELTDPVLPGDVNGDGVVDVADVNLIISIMLGKTAAVPAADVNGDGIVDVSDANLAINIMLGK